MRRVHVLYHGRVQGVGFRATTHRIAARHPVTGFVRNLPEGSVEVEVQGESAAVSAFLADVQRQFVGFITDEERAEIADAPGESAFVVQY
ncbi:MAG TPA: acylphosphatase [Planctomycetaceae bacterium]|nr:acylphosphatase [Planctomycetaceae bacterium]